MCAFTPFRGYDAQSTRRFRSPSATPPDSGTARDPVPLALAGIGIAGARPARIAAPHIDLDAPAADSPVLADSKEGIPLPMRRSNTCAREPVAGSFYARPLTTAAGVC